ncbi:hypothetical protein PY093_19215 [Cytobacillus sp. S13-E01]|uniref:hypothetical protein n=1 Tax=Cytobacillus sp. S13-E01 TaxID=3031326 RepID=UPI0023D7F6AC|nr:hypothetical protein [Cytobacillus sp. S13-E01]MDF0728753.1 hypothetical protein [Cytobacillus sp. S13-E01]
MEKYACKECGNKRWFYSEVSVPAKKLIDLKGGKDNGKVYGVDKGDVDNQFEQVCCRKCDELVYDPEYN